MWIWKEGGAWEKRDTWGLLHYSWIGAPPLPLYDFSAFLLLFSLNPIWSKKSITKLDNIVLAKKMFIVYLAQNIKFSATQIHAII